MNNMNKINTDILSILKEKYSDLLNTLENHPTHCEICAKTIFMDGYFNCDFSIDIINELNKLKKRIDNIERQD